MKERIKSILMKYPGFYYYLSWFKDCILRLKKKQKDDFFYNSHILKMNALDNTKSTFFGYYDKSPLSSGMIIFYETDSTVFKPSYKNKVNLVVYDVYNKKEVYREDIKAFNWQQGARAHWLNSNEIIFNDFLEDRYVTRIVNIKSNSEKKFYFGMADSYTEFFLTLDYSNLMYSDSAYGYFNLPSTIEPDAIKKISIINDEVKTLVSLSNVRELSKYNYKKTKETFNHICLSPKGTKFIFIYRHFKGGERYDELYLFDFKNDSLKSINTGGFVSHYCWMNEYEVFGYMSNSNGEKGFYLCDVVNNTMFQQNAISHLGDGHPTKVSESKVIFDSYADITGQQKLFIYDLDSKNLSTLGSLYHPVFFRGNSRCDLHPRYDSSTNTLFVDTVHNSKRSLVQFDLSNLIN